MFLFLFGTKLNKTKCLFSQSVSFLSTKNLNGSNALDILNKDVQRTKLLPEKIEETLKSAISPFQVLRSLPSNFVEFKDLSGETVINALRAITILKRTNAESIESKSITSHPNFEFLCRRLKTCSAMFSPSELIDSLRFLCSLGVPKNSEISLVLLNLLRHEINNLDINQIIYLDFILKKMETASELEKTIKSSLSIVFDQQILQEVDVNDSISDLVKMLNFIRSHRDDYLKNKSLKRLCKILGDKRDELNLPDAINIIHHLCAINRFKVGNVNRLMNICIRHLLKNMTKVDTNEMLLVAERLVSLTVNQYLSFQYLIHDLLNSFGEKIAQENQGLKTAIKLQAICKNISYRNTPMHEYIHNQIIANIDDCRTMELQEIFIIVQAFANNGFLNESDNHIWTEKILPAILENEKLKSISPTNRTWLQFTLQLVVLNYYNQELITRVLSSPYLDDYLRNNKTTLLDIYKLLALYQSASMHSKIDVSCVQKQVLDEAFVKYAANALECEVQRDLMQQIGNEFMIKNVRTKYSHFIPNLIKINKSSMELEQFPNDIPRDDNGFVALGDIPKSENDLLICIDVIRHYSIFSNTSRAKYSIIRDTDKIGVFRLRSHQLGQLGVSVCEINYRRYKFFKRSRLQYLHKMVEMCAQNAAKT